MKRILRTALVLLLCLTLYLCLVPAAHAEEVASGEWGNLHWTLDDVGLLTISGEGEMNKLGSTDAWRAFQNQIVEVVIMPGVTSIGEEAFGDCARLKNITIPEGVTNIGRSAFYGCRRLISMTIPKSVTGIGYSAFRGCSSLTSVTIPKSVTTIGVEAFYGCSSLTNITIPEGLTSIGEGAFSRCSSLNGIWVSENNLSFSSDAYGVLFNKGKDNLIQAPGTLNVYFVPSGVTNIGNSAFSECSSLTSITIPEGVTSIGSCAFYRCSNLTSVIIPKGVTRIDHDAFYGCNRLTSVTIPESVTSIGDGAFSGCTSLTSVTIPKGVTSIGDFAFSSCGRLTNVTIPESVTSINERAFSYCIRLTSITVPESIKYIDLYAFYACDNLKNIYYPGTKAQWEAIDIDDYNDPLLNATIHYGTVPEMYTVTYDANGGTGAPAAQTKEAGFALTLSAAVPTRESSTAGSFEVKLDSNDGSGSVTVLRAARTNRYTFKGWNTAADGTKTAYAPGAQYTLDEDLTLYAQWDSSTATAAVTLPTPTREGCIFKGWATSSSADSGITGSYTPSADVVLYAIWQSPDFILPASLTTIEAEAFAGGAFTYVHLPEGATVIRSRAFADCPNLAYIYIPEDTAVIAKDAFSGADGLTILGRSDSYAEFYAQRNGYTFIAVE